MSDGESAADSPALPPLVPQPKGGAIFRGGKPGNRGGGRPKSASRAELLRIVDEHAVPFVEAVLTGELEGVTVDQQERVAKLALQYGLGQQKELTADAVRELLMETIRAIQAELDGMIGEVITEETAVRVLARIRPIWR